MKNCGPRAIITAALAAVAGATLLGGCTSDPNSDSIFFDERGAKRENEALRDRAETDSAAAARASKRTASLRAEVDTLEKQVALVKSDLDDLQKELVEAAKTGKATERVAAAKTRVDTLRKRAGDLELAIDDSGRDTVAINDEIEKAKQQRELDARKQELAQLKAEVDTMEKQVQLLLADIGR